MFTARTTRVSNPFCDPSLHPSLSEPFSQDAFAIVSPVEINVFYHYLDSTSCVSWPQAIQYLLHALYLRYKISQETYTTSYGCFRPNKFGHDLDCRYYRGGWHRSCPVLIRLTFYIKQKFFQMEKHFGSLCHTFVHCKRSPAAALRRARNSVSDSFSGHLR